MCVRAARQFVQNPAEVTDKANGETYRYVSGAATGSLKTVRIATECVSLMVVAPSLPREAD